MGSQNLKPFATEVFHSVPGGHQGHSSTLPLTLTSSMWCHLPLWLSDTLILWPMILTTYQKLTWVHVFVFFREKCSSNPLAVRTPGCRFCRRISGILQRVWLVLTTLFVSIRLLVCNMGCSCFLHRSLCVPVWVVLWRTIFCFHPYQYCITLCSIFASGIVVSSKQNLEG